MVKALSAQPYHPVFPHSQGPATFSGRNNSLPNNAKENKIEL
jgi:hypothetical protein